MTKAETELHCSLLYTECIGSTRTYTVLWKTNIFIQKTAFSLCVHICTLKVHSILTRHNEVILTSDYPKSCTLYTVYTVQYVKIQFIIEQSCMTKPQYSVFLRSHVCQNPNVFLSTHVCQTPIFS